MSDECRRILKNLVDKLVSLNDDPTYNGVWALYHAHGQKYDGPTYEKELNEAREFLSGRLQT